MGLTVSSTRHVPDGRRAAVVLAVSGDLDLRTAPELEAAIAAVIANPADDDVVLDLGCTGFMDSSVLEVLMGADRRTRSAGVGFTVVCANPDLARIFEITHLDEVLLIAPSVAAAVA